MDTQKSNPPTLPRRQLLTRLGVAGLALAGSRASQAAVPADGPQVTDAPRSDQTQDRQAFLGRHQSGITTPRPAAGLLASFDVLAENRTELRRLFVTLTERIAFLTQGGAQPDLDPRLPPAGSGILGPVVVPDNLTLTVSLGHSLFVDKRFGLKKLKPVHLQAMTSFKNDALDAALCHGDLSLQFCANTPDTNIHALRDILKNLPDLLALRWKQEGTVPPTAVQPGKPAESARNFLGFRDGSANPDSADSTLMDRVVWVQPGSAEPAWAAHGSYQAVRIIRNFVERWDRTPLQEQEAIMGRRKATGAPKGTDGSEHDTPDYAADPHGARIRLDAHIRLANPCTPGSEANLILRRPFNYSNGVSKSGQLEMGLLFIAYQANLDAGFITVQKRLNDEPLEEYIKPVGGGYFFTLPGITEAGDFFGRALLDARA
ncbi:iron uptake transporter deferrochelatase/peroxidase subunit [Rhodoferax sp.]|uniref:iron uptake transporter deferrochelatase/peroxidase subunit n=1 Tax=Rhodoferax sp. TaxID=50421 RepID=UPI00374CCAEA